MMTDGPKSPTKAQRIATARSTARLAAVQAIYQIEMTSVSSASVVNEFNRFPLGDEASQEDAFVDADEAMFGELVTGTQANLVELDAEIAKVLSAEWPLERLEMVLRAILRVGAYELAFRIDVPARVVINEYVDIAHAFFAGKEPGMVNGVLDKLAHGIRVTEMGRDKSS
jgi:transcription antitermination protein NusB